MPNWPSAVTAFGSNHQHHAWLKNLLVLFGLDVVGEDVGL